MSQWERDFVDGVWIEGYKLTVKQIIVLEDIYGKFRGRPELRKAYVEPIGYGYQF